MPKPKKSKLPLFDIRVHSADNTILLKGAPTDAYPTLLSGTIALSVTEPFTVKRMKLKLYATLSFNWDEKYHNGKGQIFTKPFRFNKMIYCFDWDQLNLEKFLHTHDPLQSQFLAKENSSNSLENIARGIGFTTGTLTRTNNTSSNNLQRLGSTTTLNSFGSSTSIPALNALSSHNKSSNNLSTINLSSLGNHSSSEPVVLQPGNYEFPFQAILDGSIPESIIDHPCCSLVYRLQCVIERGRFSNPLITRKILHVIRTLSPDNPELSETVAVDNSWPKKIDYSISVPTKAIAIGSSCQIFISMAPLQKGLKLGSIKIKLIESGIFSTTAGQHSEEKTLTTKHIPKVTTNPDGVDIWSDDSPVDEDGVFYRSHSLVLSNDKWDVTTSLQLPASLEMLTQDLDIVNLCKIRHKLKFSVALINPDGHISELRATLPITLFISPFIPTKVKAIEEYDDPFKNAHYEDVTIHTTDEKMIFQNEDTNATVLHTFHDVQPHHNHVNDVPESDGTVPLPNINTQDLMAPPNYDDRIYDRVYILNSTNIEMNANLAANGNITLNVNTENDENGNNQDTLNNTATNNDINNTSILSDLNDSTLTTGADLNPFAISSPIKGNSRKYQKPIFSMGDDEDEDEESSILDPFESKVSLPHQNEAQSTSLPSALPILQHLQPSVPSHAPLSSSSFSNTLPTIHQNVISGPAFNSGERVPISHTPSNGYLMSPGTLSPVQHLSRATSFIGDPHTALGSVASMPTLSHAGSAIDTKTLKQMSKPPSYDVAIHSVASFKDLTPVYTDSETDLRSNLHILDSRLQNLRLSRLDQQNNYPQATASPSTGTSPHHSQSMGTLGHFKSRSPYGHGLLNHSYSTHSTTNNVGSFTPTSHTPTASLSRNISSTSLISSKREFHLTSIPQATSRLEVGSPQGKSNVTTPITTNGSQAGYFSLHPHDHVGSENSKLTCLSSPKAAHLTDSLSMTDSSKNNNGGTSNNVSRKSSGFFGSFKLPK